MKDFEAINVGTDPVFLNRELAMNKIIKDLRPVKLYLKEDGSLTNKPSITIVSVDDRFTVVSQISIEMLNDGLADIGYEFKKKEPGCLCYLSDAGALIRCDIGPKCEKSLSEHNFNK